jgi:dipeptidase D
MTFVSELEPQPVWSHFDRILTIPRPSKGEEEIRRYVVERAEARGLETRRDAAGNVVVTVPATAGHEDAPVVVLQSHLDMVQEKDRDVDFDFAKDAIRPVRDGEYLKADGTTLGSDNGMGVAAMLAVMESGDLVHGPLELLFTMDEETGLTGASELAPDLLHGERLLNLDTEEEGALYVGCAGGGDSLLRLPLADEAATGGAVLEVKLTGLKGGHSGVDIHLQRGNAIQLLARILHAAEGEIPFPVGVVAFEGGTAHNAIPREAFATVRVPAGEEAAFEAAVRKELEKVRNEYRPADPDVELDVHRAAGGADRVLDAATSRRVLSLLAALPHGVQAMSYDIPDLVETSTNLATVKRKGGVLEVLMSSRSSVDSAIAALRGRIRAVGELAGADVEEGGGYPGWKPDMDSELLRVMRRLHEEVLGEEPEVKAIHAGLETGIIGEKYPGMDMISFGPQIEFPHSPDERVHVASVGRFWKLLKATLAELA